MRSFLPVVTPPDSPDFINNRLIVIYINQKLL